ncbi:hypothetical protein X777_02696 [Ooceraea biroi]|uniref:Uncharacterized protein n=1 Tax=Ooceraea biroi TaxID=2015173 RepID=A0A026WLD0_OOCBI|nr:hypothetical protein X777_02696 [Ooceraea biroi]
MYITHLKVCLQFNVDPHALPIFPLAVRVGSDSRALPPSDQKTFIQIDVKPVDTVGSGSTRWSLLLTRCHVR